MARGGRNAPQSAKVQRDVRWLGAAILAACVTVAGFGLAMGLYLDHAPEAPPTPAKSAEDAPTLAPLPVAAIEALPAEAKLASEPAVMPQAPPVAAETPPPIAAPQLDTAAAAEPQAGTSAPEPAAASSTALVAAFANPPPPPRSDAGGYWVEYAVFAHERSAEHLRHTLAALHLETRVVATHAPDGRRLWRVRSAMAARAGAEADARLARQRLSLEPLLHHAAQRPARRAQYWVQFGAFPMAAPAVHLRQVLADNGVKAIVLNTRTSTGKSLYLVRSYGFPDRHLATLIGELGGSAANVAFLVGRSSSSRHAAGHDASAGDAAGSSVPGPSHVPRRGGG